NQVHPAPADLRPHWSNLISNPGTAVTAMPGAPAGFPELNFFRRSQFRAARPRVAITLFFSGCHWLFCQHTEVSFVNPFAEGIFDDAVFQRMKTDHHHASTRLQDRRRRRKQRLQIVQFAVYEDSKSLKSSRRGMNSSLSLIHWPGRG